MESIRYGQNLNDHPLAISQTLFVNNLFMKISAVIPTKNRVEDLVKAVESVLIQSRPPDELLIIDQSVDITGKSKIENLLGLRRSRLLLKYIYDPEITGLVDAKRVAVREAIGDVICFLEDDVVLDIGYIASMEKVFFEHPKMMGCCGIVTNFPDTSGFYVNLFHLFHRGIFYDQRVGVHGFSEKPQRNLILSSFLSGGTSAFRREVFDVVKFDMLNNFFMLEDIDFSTRANTTFGRVFYINTQAKLAHYMSPVNRDVYQPRYQRKLREFIVFYKKHTRGFQDFLTLIWLLVGLILEAVFVALSSCKLGPIKGCFIGIKEGLKWKLVDEVK